MQKGCIVISRGYVRENFVHKFWPVVKLRGGHGTRGPREETIGREGSRGEARSVKVGAQHRSW